VPHFTVALCSVATIATCAGLAAAAPPGPVVRDATARDNAERSGGPGATEWWFTGVIDPVSGEAFAASLGTRMASGPAATAVLSLPPRGGERTLGHLRLGAQASRTSVDVRLGPDSLREIRPGVYRLKVRGVSGFALHGSPATVSADLVIRRTAPGFVAGPMRLGRGQYVGWTVAAPRAQATGTFRVGSRTVRVKNAPAYHDHNWGRFSLSGGRLAGWDWSQAFLPGGRALTVGVVKGITGPPDGVAVLSGPTRRLGAARSASLNITYRGWKRAGDVVYPPTMRQRGTLGRWRVDLTYTARTAAPLPFDQKGGSALVEVLARVNGTIRGPGGRVVRVTDAPAFYEYQSTPLSRRRDGAPPT
jgi:hypothetical protein